MATLTSAAGQAVSPAHSKKRRRPQGQSSVWRWVVMIIAGIYFLVPLYAALRFAGLSGFKDVFTTPGFGSSLWLSIRLAAVTWIVSMLLMIPTTVYVHLRMPGLRRLLGALGYRIVIDSGGETFVVRPQRRRESTKSSRRGQQTGEGHPFCQAPGAEAGLKGDRASAEICGRF